MPEDKDAKRVRIVEEIAAMQPWDRGPLSLAHEIRSFLIQGVADQFTNVDSGGGDGIADLWVTVQGVEYHIGISRSKGSHLDEQSGPYTEAG